MAYRSAALALAFGLASCATPGDPALAEFERALAAQDSATAALARWCDARDIADPPFMSARPVNGEPGAIPAGLRKLLRIVPDDRVGYRHVRLTCGDAVLSEAHNWYVPGRLTPEMNRTLESTDTPFGRVVSPPGFTRERLESVRGPAPGCPQATILSHRAVLKRPDGKPISLVVECYSAANLAGD